MSQMLNLTIFLLKSFQENNTNYTLNNNTNDDPYESEENENEGYLYLLLLDFFIFCSLTYTTYTSSKKLDKEGINPDDFRPKFIKFLVLANGLRTLSLIFILVIHNPNGNNGISWINSLLHVVPAFIFVSSYMYLATFFSDLYYQSIGYNNHLLKPALTMMVNGGYLFLAFVAVFTLFLKAYKAFFYISELLMALLYLSLGTVIFYFGRKASEIFRSKSNAFDTNETDKKLGYMSCSIGGLFVIKGVSGVLGGIGAYDPGNHNVYDFLWFLVLEVLPTVIFIYFAKKKDVSPNVDTPRDTLNDMESMNTSLRNTSFRPPFEKE